MINKITKDRIAALSKQYKKLAKEKPEAVREIALSEIPEMVYNSNAIENSTLTLQDTEDILLRGAIKRDYDIREIYEANNLAQITEQLLDKPNQPLSSKLILDLHKVLLSDIKDEWAGRFRSGKEWVRVGTHVGTNPDFVGRLVNLLVGHYNEKDVQDFIENISWFHAEFETIHPFNDGNGRLGRVLVNQQLGLLGLPPIIIPNKSKHTSYYPAFDSYRTVGKFDDFTNIVASLLIESLYRRITLLSSPNIITVSEWAKANGIAGNIAVNKAIRGTIPAFRLRGKWMITEDFKDEKRSAGGVVYSDGKFLVMRTIPYVETILPKGTIEEGETPEQAAVREVLEETGYKTRITAELGEISYEFDGSDGKRCHKTVYYYLMALIDKDAEPTPNLQAGENFENIWLTADEAMSQLTYDNSRNILQKALDILS